MDSMKSIKWMAYRCMSMAQQTAANPDAIALSDVEEHVGAEPGESVSPIRLHTAIDHRAAFLGGAPVHVPAQDD